ncbi:MAG TPA: aminoacetone oxidase family FAD-binding enzyme [Lachnospiraceae bacterium]|nr:aminoacetone oxidase family FAD-binding enzyme [Lachnospiraceae bacterium]
MALKRVIVVGGGAAGMMAALAAAEKGCRVFLIEKNEKLGKKLFITGKGRCNVTSAGDMDALFAHVRSNEKFLYSAFYGYDNRAVMHFLEKAGCPLKIERGERVFPVSDHSSDVIAAFQRELRKRKVEILLNTEVQELILEEVHNEPCEKAGQKDGEGNEKAGQKDGEGNEKAGRIRYASVTDSKEQNDDKKKTKAGKETQGTGRIAGVRLRNGKILPGDSCIVCTGGISYPSTGSTGDGYRFAEETGHKLIERTPSLVPMNIKEDWCARLMGLSLKNVSVSMVRGRKTLYEGFGEMLFTHFGVSGPLILSASSYYGQSGKGAGKSREAQEETMLYIDLKPALDPEQVDRRLLRDFEANRGKQFKNSLGGLFPASLIPVMVELSGIHPDKKGNEVTREERRNFAGLMKKLPLTVTGLRGFEEAIITRGGISVKDVNPSTMESKKVRGLYFAGEVLDLDALTGGYNLQIAWSTGHLAGDSQ